MPLLKQFSPMTEAFYSSHAEFHKASFCFLKCFFVFQPCLRIEFVSIANHLFFKRFGLEIPVRKRQVLVYDLVERKSCASMSLTYSCVSFKTFAAKHLCASQSVTDIGLCSEAVDCRCVAADDAYIVKHSSLRNEVLVEIKFGMVFCDDEGTFCYSPAMNKENVAQCNILLIVFINNL